MAVGCSLAAVAGTWADQAQKIASDGTVHSVEEAPWSADGQSAAGSMLIHAIQLPGGSSDAKPVPGTEDFAIDREPSIDLDGDGHPVLVWVRNQGTGFGLFVSRHDGSRWTPPQSIFVTGADKATPDLEVRTGWVHLTWREGAAGSARFLRGVLDASSLEVLHGPEELTTDDGQSTVPPDGEPQPGSSPEPPRDHVFDARPIPPTVPGDPGKVFLWGVQDEPIPIGYKQGFELPADVRDVRSLQTTWLGDRLTLSFSDAAHFHYIMRKDGRWLDWRRVQLDAETTPETALLQLREMVRKESLQTSE